MTEEQLDLIDTEELLASLGRRLSIVVIMEKQTNRDCVCGGDHKQTLSRVWYPHDTLSKAHALGLATHGQSYLSEAMPSPNGPKVDGSGQ